MSFLVEAFKLAITKPLHGLVLCLCGGGVWLASVVIITMQPAIAANTHQLFSANAAIAHDHNNIVQIQESTVKNSVQLARIEGMLEILVERTESQ